MLGFILLVLMVFWLGFYLQIRSSVFLMIFAGLLIFPSLFYFFQYAYLPSFLILGWGLYLLAFMFVAWPFLRIFVISKPLFNYFKKALPPISKTEQEALEAGDVWWEAELFRGKPNWSILDNYKIPNLSSEEQSFLNNQVEILCSQLNDWEINQDHHDLPLSVWEYLKKEKFFGMVIEKKYGGLGFSALGHSAVIVKIASRSMSAAINTMVPNSLGPGELLHRYGTEEQKNYYLPRLANGQEIPCFGLTSLEAGSDAGAMKDQGFICKRLIEGQEIIGISLNFSKRYITLAPIATLIGLAFKLFDPEHILGPKEDLGITVALLSAKTPGIEIGQRHFPLGMAFMNGPIQGEDVFISLDAIIGGATQIGQGWRMLMECLSIGRSISLPALSTAGVSLAYRMTSAYASLRQQFKMSIGKFEGVALALAKIAGGTYTVNACRRLSCAAVDLGYKPSVVSAMAKYHCTEINRQVIDLALDIHAGRAIQQGPKNYLANLYMAVPIKITVEGANILTRNLIIFGQGAIRCHPYILTEMNSVQSQDIKKFDKTLRAHICYALSNFCRSFFYGLSNGKFISSPKADFLSYYYRQLTRMSTALALVSDMAMLILGGELKRKEALSARLGDVLSGLYLSSALLKFYEDSPYKEEEKDLLCWSLDQQLANIQIAFSEFFDNFSKPYIGKLLKFIIFPWGRVYKNPLDSLGWRIVKKMLIPGNLRDRLSDLCYIGASDQPVGIMEKAFNDLAAVGPLEEKLYKVNKANPKQQKMDKQAQIKNAQMMGDLSLEEGQQLNDFEKLRQQVLSVDQFSADYFKKRSL